MFTKQISSIFNRFSNSMHTSIDNVKHKISESLLEKIVAIGAETFQAATKQFGELNLEGKKIIKEELNEMGNISKTMLKDLGSQMASFFSALIKLINRLNESIVEEMKEANSTPTLPIDAFHPNPSTPPLEAVL